tara:strand:+ start:4234 stop:4695 length:462 start_codon:yes stop_codon:yes gene_type:complete
VGDGMSKATLEKRIDGSFVTATPQDAEVMQRLKIGDGVVVEFKVMRNYKFHKKYFALLNLAYESWETAEGAPEKNFQQFRDDITILSGHYIQVVRVDNSVRTIAKSVSFASMDADEFERLYDKTCTVLINRILTTYTRPDIDRVINQISEFAT